MVSFNSRYVENQVREILRRTIFPGAGRMPLLEAQVLTHECLTKIEYITIGCDVRDIRGSAMHNFWQTEMSTPWCSFTWCSLNLDYDELIKSDGWVDDLKQFSHIHTFYCAKQVPYDLISNFKNVQNFGLSDMDIHGRYRHVRKPPNAIRAYWGAVAIVRVKPVKQCN